MIKEKHKIISVVLCVALVLTSLIALAFSVNVSAASGDTIYVKVNNGWNTSVFYCYMWKGGGGSGNQNDTWPGVQMTKVSGTSNIFSYTLTDNYEKLIFNEGQGGQQTGDLTYTGNGGDGKIYDMQAGTWSQYVEPTTGASQSTQATQATQATSSGSGMTVYLKNTKNWSTPYCYMWNGSGGSGNENYSWAGEAMTSVGDDIWMYTASKVYSNCIFSNNGQNQTSNLTAQDGYRFDPSTNSWEVHDTSTLQVRGYSADPATGIYPGMEVTLSATGVSPQGDVSYQFSVNGAVIRAFAAGNTATWTPTATGTYNVTFDFRDTAGNTNQRELTLTVDDDSTLAKPVIKKIAPALGSYVRTGSTATISVTAGGGKTGTNLLFYKYVITDPTGEKNVPYYTLNGTYSFVPTKEGEYTIAVYVQGSDNTTVNKSFTVIATGGDIPTTAQPTTVQPTTVQPTTVQPTTVQPTTVQPTTVQPTTVKPTTQPTTVKPTTQPTTVQPTTLPDGTYQLGDVNMDGKVNIKDATYIQKYLAEYRGYYVSVELGDMNRDGKVSIKDVTAIQRYIAMFG